MGTEIKWYAIKYARKLVELYDDPPKLSIIVYTDYLSIFGEKFDFAIAITEELIPRHQIYLFDIVDLLAKELNSTFEQYFTTIGQRIIINNLISADEAKVCIRKKRYDHQIFDNIEYYYQALNTKNIQQNIFNKIIRS